MIIQIITLFPEMFEGYFSSSMMLKAQKINKLNLKIINLRDFGLGTRKVVDDIPYGGGDGMVLKIEPLVSAVEFAKKQDESAQVLLMTPRGEMYSQQLVQGLATKKNGMIIICGRYEGYDERITKYVDRQISIGNYVLTGGELPAMIVADSVVRLIPGVLGGETSAEKESFSDGSTVEHPQYTRPELYEDMKVPEVLLSGHHREIAKWRNENSKQTS